MRVIRLALNINENMFWMLGDIKLDINNPHSDYINIDNASDTFIDMLNLSIKRLKIFAFDTDNNRLFSLEDLILEDNSISIEIDDTEEDETIHKAPEIISITEEDDTEEEVPLEEHINEAKILLTKKGNTAKKIIRNMQFTDFNYFVIMAALDIEKTRAGVIKELKTKKSGFNR